MKNSERYLQHAIAEELNQTNKMVFISGPRQVGKTTLARAFLESEENYLSYDKESFRRKWAKDPDSALQDIGTGSVVLDEIHKDRLWKRKLKGIYDHSLDGTKIIVTGSARLDVFRRGSDSLLGRYLPYRLHPVTMGESAHPPCADDIFDNKSVINHSLQDLLHLGGFPEPLFNGKEGHALRWSRLRLERLVHEDTRDFLTISDLRAFQILVELLAERVGSPLFVNVL